MRSLETSSISSSPRPPRSRRARRPRRDAWSALTSRSNEKARPATAATVRIPWQRPPAWPSRSSMISRTPRATSVSDVDRGAELAGRRSTACRSPEVPQHLLDEERVALGLRRRSARPAPPAVPIRLPARSSSTISAGREPLQPQVLDQPLSRQALQHPAERAARDRARCRDRCRPAARLDLPALGEVAQQMQVDSSAQCRSSNTSISGCTRCGRALDELAAAVQQVASLLLRRQRRIGMSGIALVQLRHQLAKLGGVFAQALAHRLAGPTSRATRSICSTSGW